MGREGSTNWSIGLIVPLATEKDVVLLVLDFCSKHVLGLCAQMPSRTCVVSVRFEAIFLPIIKSGSEFWSKEGVKRA